MVESGAKELVVSLFNQADIKLNGHRPWDIQVNNENFYTDIINHSSLGLGESYVKGYWDCQELDQMLFRLMRNDVKNPKLDFHTLAIGIRSFLSNLQSPARSKQVAEVHYNLPSKLYELFLGPYNQYTSLYYRRTSSFEKAEIARLELIAKKLQINSQDYLLDIGCGWGGFAGYISDKYKCKVLGISIAKEQIEYARKKYASQKISFKVMDYRELLKMKKGVFTKIFSGGMFEHVGYKNYRTYINIVNHCLDKDGLFLLDVIGHSQESTGPDPWIEKYIFPNSMVPAPTQITRAIDGIFQIEDWHNFGADYDKTIMGWLKNFKLNWPKIRNISPQFDNNFYRMWVYYLCVFAGAMRARMLHQWQIVLSKKGLIGGYASIR